MTKTVTVDSLDISQDLQFQKKFWVVQRIGWVFFIFLTLFAALGGFGKGVLSNKTMQQDNISLNYQTVGRYQSPNSWELTINQTDKPIVVEIDQKFFKDNEVLSILPEPTDTSIVDNKYRFVFDTEKGTVHITLQSQPEYVGYRNGTVQINNSRFRVYQFVYP